MSLWRQLRHGLRVLTSRAAADRDVADEVAHYIEHATASLIAEGVAPAEARRRATLDVGNATVVRERIRSYGWENAVSTVVADVRLALRRLRSAPAFTAGVLVTLALGIGGTTAIFSAVNRTLFDALPYPRADRLAMIVEMGPNGARTPGTFAMYHRFSERARSFEALAVLGAWQPTLIGSGVPERLRGQRVSASYFRVLGVHPARGRDLLASDDVSRGPKVVVISDRLWRQRFAANAAIVGSQVDLDDDPYRVVGVMPPDFENVLDPAADVWAPLQYDLTQARAWGHHLRTVGRLRDGVGIERGSREIDALGRALLREQRPETYDLDTRFVASPLRDDLTRGVRTTFLAILAGVLLVLVIACVNVANLQAARGVRRRGEFALRTALGAGTGRLVRQVLVESLTLALLGGVAGAGLAVAGVRLLATIGASGLPRTPRVGLDGSMFAFTLGITMLVGVVLGVIPALQAVRGDRQRDLQPGSRRATAGRGATRRALVVVEVALALVLLVTSGLLLRSLQRLFAVDVGFDPARVVTLQVQATGHRFDQDRVTYDFFTRALSAVRGVPGVVSAGLTSQLPLSGDLDEYGASFPAADGRAAAAYSAYRYAVSPGYLETMGIPLVRGRLLSEDDRAGAPPAALISESLARLRFGAASPIEHVVRIGGGSGSRPFTIVGVVGDVRQVSLALGRSEAIYTTTAQWRWADRAMSLVVRTRGEADALVPAIRRAIWSVDPTQPIVRVAEMSELITASAAERRFALAMFEAFAIAALLLAAAGISGVLAEGVAERTREIGIRTALGATPGGVLALIARQGLLLAGAGAAIGLAASVATSRAISSLLFAVSPLDPVTYVGVLGLLLVVSLLACWVPARRAARVDPAITLRAD